MRVEVGGFGDGEARGSAASPPGLEPVACRWRGRRGLRPQPPAAGPASRGDLGGRAPWACLVFGLALLATPAAAQSIQPLHAFAPQNDGEFPSGTLAISGGLLYGTTYLGGAAGLGTVFVVDPLQGLEKIVHSFAGGSDGAYPQAGLIAGDGTLYGTTAQGGANGAGIVFGINPRNGAEHVIHSFSGGTDGGSPSALVFLNRVLYGTTPQGGAANAGTVFAIDTRTRAYRLLYSFTGGKDGGYPAAGLTWAGGKLYGTTTSFGSAGNGTVFSLDPAGWQETTLYSFTASDDGTPGIGALVHAGRRLFGTTQGYGASGMGIPCNQACGAVYEIDLATNAESVLYRFQGGAADGANPAAALTYLHGTLYGTTYDGGGFFCNGVGRGCGTVFAVNAYSGKETVITAFTGAGGWDAPEAALLPMNGILYGTDSGAETIAGCHPGCGGVFALTP